MHLYTIFFQQKKGRPIEIHFLLLKACSDQEVVVSDRSELTKLGYRDLIYSELTPIRINLNW